MRVLELVKEEYDKGNIMLGWEGNYRRRLRFNKKYKITLFSLHFLLNLNLLL